MRKISKSEVVVVHGSGFPSDNALRARAVSVGVVWEMILAQTRELLDMEVDRVIIFSWSHTHGKGKPSEAKDQYDIFLKRLKLLDKSGKIPGGISFPDQTEWLNHWKIRVGTRDITIYIEDQSVDTEDNAERSKKIIKKIVEDGKYNIVSISPFSSDFHTKRIWEAFERNFFEWFPQAVTHIHSPISAEKILKNSNGRYKKYGELKEESIWPQKKIIEVILRTVSRSQLGRDAIRIATQRRVEK